MTSVDHTGLNGTAQVPEPARRESPAHRIASDAEALSVARALAAEFREEAAARDRERRLPFAEIQRFSQSGLWGITVPKAYGGAGVSNGTLAEVVATISAADASIGQIPQNHYYMVEAIRLDASEEQKRFYFQQVLDGDRFGNALSEIGTKRHTAFITRIAPAADGQGYILDGQKFYSTGVLFAHWIAAVAHDDEKRGVIVLLRRDAAGLTLVDDWTGFGQRTTGSGTTRFTSIRVGEFALVPHWKAFARPTPMGAVAQLLHAAVDLGIARAAFADALEFVRTKSRPWIDSGADQATDDPLTRVKFGELQVRLRAAESLVQRAARFVDAAQADPGAGHSEAASIAVAEAKVLTTEVSLQAGSTLFELAGAGATAAKYGLDRHWRNARTHTIHDPIRWKYHAIGNYFLNGIDPPRHGAL